MRRFCNKTLVASREACGSESTSPAKPDQDPRETICRAENESSSPSEYHEHKECPTLEYRTVYLPCESCLNIRLHRHQLVLDSRHQELCQPVTEHATHNNSNKARP